MNKGKTDDKLAEKWACDPHTIRRWRKAGAPLSNEKRMRTWLAGRKHLPPGTTTLIQESRAVETSNFASADQKLPTGAAFALKRLEQMEARMFTQLSRAMEGGDPIEVKTARESWQKVCEQLRKADLAIEQSRRDAGELVPREQVEYLAGELSLALYHSLWAIDDIVPLLVGLESPHDIFKVLAEVKSFAHQSIISWLQRERAPGHEIPKWLIKAVSTERNSNRSDDRMEAYAKLWAVMKTAMQGVAQHALDKLKRYKETEQKFNKATDPKERSKLYQELEAVNKTL